MAGMKIADGWSMTRVVLVGPHAREIELTRGLERGWDWEVSSGPLWSGRGTAPTFHKAVKAAVNWLGEKGGLIP